MPAFGSNSIVVKFAIKVLREPLKGFRLSDRIVSALDRFVGALVGRFTNAENPLLTRWLFIYPFVGAANWTHALNLADVEGNFERFKITWSGGVVHNENGVTMVAGSEGNTHCDCADASKAPPAGCVDAWVYKTFGVYSRTNIAVNMFDVFAEFYEPQNGYNYYQGMIVRYATDGNFYADQCVHYRSGTASNYNRAQVYTGDSLGLHTTTQRGTIYAPYHFLTKRGTYVAGESTSAIGMGYGAGLGVAVMKLMGSGRNYGFFFSTKNEKHLGGVAGLPGDYVEFDLFVEQLQIALSRNV